MTLTEVAEAAEVTEREVVHDEAVPEPAACALVEPWANAPTPRVEIDPWTGKPVVFGGVDPWGEAEEP